MSALRNKEIEIINASASLPAIESLMLSLDSARLTELEWSGRYSRSGATYYVKRFRATLVTSKHTHELSCFVRNATLFCDWNVDGRYVATIEIKPLTELWNKLIEALDLAIRMEKEEENRVILREHPLVELE